MKRIFLISTLCVFAALFSHAQKNEIDCVFLQNAIVAVQHNNPSPMGVSLKTAQFSTDKNIALKTSLMPGGTASIGKNKQGQLYMYGTIKNDAPTDEDMDPFFLKIRTELIDCMNKNRQRVVYSYAQDYQFYVESNNYCISIMLSGEGYDFEVRNIAPIIKNYKLPIFPIDQLVKLINMVGKNQLATIKTKDIIENFPTGSYVDGYSWYGTKLNIKGFVTSVVEDDSNKNDQMLVCLAYNMPFYSRAKTAMMQNYADNIHQQLKQKGVRIKTVDYDNGTYIIQTDKVQLMLSYEHDLNNIGLAQLEVILQRY